MFLATSIMKSILLVVGILLVVSLLLILVLLLYSSPPLLSKYLAANSELFDIKIKMVIIDETTVILVMVVYCVHHNGCNTNVYCFIGCIDYNCLNGL